MAMTAIDDRVLIERHIEPDPHRPGIDDARLIEFGVPVWALIGHYHAVAQDAAQVADDYAIPYSAMQAALAYYRLHKTVIDARIAANAA
jgi:uncharacterized protein (DUF433 family)